MTEKLVKKFERRPHLAHRLWTGLSYVKENVVFSLYAAIVTAYETNTQHDPNNNNAMLGVHASASAIIQYGKIGRKQVPKE